MEQAELFKLIEASHDAETIRKNQVDQVLRRTDGSIIIKWKPRKWVLTDFELTRKFGLEWLKSKSIKV